MAEIELSALNGQCLDRRIPDLETLRSHIAAWENDRNNRQSKILAIFYHRCSDKTETSLSETVNVTWY